jgi:DNA/RNA-binding domain of Phe-tRNA-synthetase-like protein
VSETPLLVVDPAWYESHPGATVGVLAIRGVTNPSTHAGLNDLAAALEADLCARLGDVPRDGLRAIPPLPAYAAYYKRWGQRYHVAMQLESVAQKGKAIPRVAALVEAMFVPELRNLLLTGGHDLDAITLPVRLGVGTGEPFRSPSGAELTVKPGDMFTADAYGRVLSAVVTGPSDFARIGPETTGLVVVVYAPPGIEPSLVSSHLDEIAANARLISGEAAAVGRAIVTADGGDGVIGS